MVKWEKGLGRSKDKLKEGAKQECWNEKADWKTVGIVAKISTRVEEEIEVGLRRLSYKKELDEVLGRRSWMQELEGVGRRRKELKEVGKET